MARVEWSRLSADDVEHVVGILLARKFPRATRIRPATGDGGIDMLVPLGDGDAIAVYQVKYFSSNLGATQKTQIKESFSRLMAFAREKHLNVTEWHLTLPLDPTPGNYLKWLKDVTKGFKGDVEWKGLIYLDGLAAEYPSVIDYYLGDGRQRLQDAIDSLSGVARMSLGQLKEGGGPLEPHEVTQGLSDLHKTLNEHDPLYYYDYSVDTVRPEVPDQPGLVAAVQQGDADRCVTFKIFARCRESEALRPVPLTVNIKAEPGSQLAADLEAFATYGKPFEAPAGTVDGEIDLPGGLGGPLVAGGLKIMPAESVKPAYSLRLQIVDPTGFVVAETLCSMGQVSEGAFGQGVRAHGREVAGVFDFEFLTDLANSVSNVSFTGRDLRGADPERVFPGLRFLSLCRHPNALRFAEPKGPVSHAPLPLPETTTAPRDASLMAMAVQSLIIIQSWTTRQLSVPDFTVMTVGEARRLEFIARLLRGEEVSWRWSEYQVSFRRASLPEGDAVAIASVEPLVAVLDGERLQLGWQVVRLPAVHLELLGPDEDEEYVRVRLTPVDDLSAVAVFSAERPEAD